MATIRNRRGGDDARWGGRSAGRAGLESLEPRRLLALVAWTGAAGDGFWHTAGNWDGGLVPTAADDVVVDLPDADPLITLDASSGVQQVRSLVAREPLVLSAGATLQVATTASLESTLTLSGGTLRGGTWVVAAPARLLPTSAGGTLQSVNLAGEVSLDTPAAVITLAGTTRFTQLRLAAADAVAQVAGGYVLLDPLRIEGTDPGTRRVRLDGQAGTFVIGTTGQLSVQPGFSGEAIIDSSGGAMTLANHGILAAESDLARLTIATSWFGNFGETRALPGPGLRVLATDWINRGTLRTDGALLVLGGRFDTSLGAGTVLNSGGVFEFAGTLANRGNTFTLGGTGAWRLVGGTIEGGNLAIAGGQRLVLTPQGGTLRDLSVQNAPLLLDDAGATVRIDGTTRFASARLIGANTAMAFSPGYVLGDTIYFDGAGTADRYIEMADASGSFTVGELGLITTTASFGGRGVIGASRAFSGQMALVNRGTIASEVAGRSVVIAAPSFTNWSTVLARGGATLAIESPSLTNFSAGVLTGGFWLATEGGTLRLNGVQVTRLAAAVGLYGQTSAILSTLTGSTSALATLASVASRGSLTLFDRHELRTSSAFVNEGILEVGADGRLTITGSFAQTWTGTTTVYADTPGGVAGVGQISASGTLQLGGTLRVVQAGTFNPAASASFIAIVGSSRTGEFSEFDEGDPTIGGRPVGLRYTANSATLAIRPRATSTPDLAAASDSGQSSTDDITRLRVVTLTGTTSDAGTLRVFADGTLIGTTTVSSGNWTVAVTLPREGVNTITTTLTDSGGDVSLPSPALAVTLDTIGPLAFDPRFVVARPQYATFRFTEDVGTSLAAGDVELVRTTTAQAQPFNLTYSASGARADVIAPTGPFPSGRYLLRLPAGAVEDLAGNPMTVPLEFSFFFFVGDMNLDGQINNQDISPFVLALTDPASFTALYGFVPIDAGDANLDGTLNNQDIAPFVDLLTTGQPSWRPAPASAAGRFSQRPLDELPGDDEPATVTRAVATPAPRGPRAFR